MLGCAVSQVLRSAAAAAMQRQAHTQTHTASDSDALDHDAPPPSLLPFAGIDGIWTNGAGRTQASCG